MAQAYVHTDLVSLGQNPEMADIDNPRGDIMGYSARVYVEKDNGERLSHFHSAENRNNAAAVEAVQALCDRINTHLAAGKALDPAHWREEQPAYGSAAYEAGGWERIQSQLEREYD